MTAHRLVIVGTGNSVGNHLKSIQKLGDRTEIVAAVDLDAERVQAFCKENNIPNWYTSVTEMLAAEKPNIVYIMSDELAYYELSHMGNTKLHTPNVDRMATEGLRFTSALAGAPVCAPLRCSLMTGKHMGHASVRANDGGTPLRAEEQTVASMLKQLGYATGGFGKWGCGGRGQPRSPPWRQWPEATVPAGSRWHAYDKRYRCHIWL